MGCFNATCMLSGLTINHHDPIVLIFMVQNKTHFGVGTTHYWQPVGLPIMGEYNDYGGIENIVDDENCKIMTDYLIKNMEAGERSNPENPYHQFKTPTDMESIIDTCRYSKLTHNFNNIFGKKDIGELHYTMILKSVWDKSIEMFDNLKSWNGKPVIEGFKKSNAELFDIILKYAKEVLSEEHNIDITDINSLKDVFETMSDNPKVQRIGFRYCYSYEAVLRSVWFYNDDIDNHLFLDLIFKVRDESESLDLYRKLQTLLTPFAKVKYILVELNRVWIPFMYAGQGDHDDRVLEFIDNVVKPVLVERQENQEDYD